MQKKHDTSHERKSNSVDIENHRPKSKPVTMTKRISNDAKVGLNLRLLFATTKEYFSTKLRGFWSRMWERLRFPQSDDSCKIDGF